MKLIGTECAACNPRWSRCIWDCVTGVSPLRHERLLRHAGEVEMSLEPAPVLH